MTSWQPADNYDPEAFYTESSDRKGRSEHINIRVPADMVRRMAVLVEGGKVPNYQTKSDFIRDAIIHRLYYIAELIKDQELKRAVSMAVMLANLRATETERESYYELMAIIDTDYVELVTAGKTAAAQNYIKNMLAQIDAIPERYQDDYEKRLGAKLYPI